MVKLVEVDEQSDADRDEECYEIDPAEFAKKVNLKETDDVILVAAKGENKLEVVEPEEDIAKPSFGYGFAATCSRIRESGGVIHDSRQEFAAGDSMGNPYQIEEDEPVFLQMEIVEDRFTLDKSLPDFGADDNNMDERHASVTPYKIVVKAEPDELKGVHGGGHDAYNHCNEMNSGLGAEDDKEGQFFHGGKAAVDVVPDKLGAKPSGTAFNNGVDVVPDNLVAKCEPVNGDSVKGAGEDTYDHCLEMTPMQKTFGEEGEDDFVLVGESDILA